MFAENRYFDVYVEYAKADVEDVLIKITAVNRGPEAATVHLLPSLWFRNTWSWGKDTRRPVVRKAVGLTDCHCVEVEHWQYGKRWLLCAGQPELLFTENETDFARLFSGQNRTPYVKDAFHEYLIGKKPAAVNPAQTGTKMAAHYPLTLNPGESATLKLRLTDIEPLGGLDSKSPEGEPLLRRARRGRGARMYRRPTISAPALTGCLRCAAPKRTNSTRRAPRKTCRMMRDR